MDTRGRWGRDQLLKVDLGEIAHVAAIECGIICRRKVGGECGVLLVRPLAGLLRSPASLHDNIKGAAAVERSARSIGQGVVGISRCRNDAAPP